MLLRNWTEHFFILHILYTFISSVVSKSHKYFYPENTILEQDQTPGPLSCRITVNRVITPNNLRLLAPLAALLPQNIANNIHWLYTNIYVSSTVFVYVDICSYISSIDGRNSYSFVCVHSYVFKKYPFLLPY